MARPSFADLLKTNGRHPQGDSLYLTVCGPKSARWEFRMRFGKTLKSFWLGSAIGPGALSLTQARAERARIWLENRRNIAAPHQGRSVAAGKSFAEVVPEWLTANADTWQPKGIAARRGLTSLSLAKMDIAKITQADVLASLANETPRQHASKRSWLADLFAYAKVQGWRAANSDNPARFDKDTAAGFPKVGDSKHFKAVPVAELPSVFAALPDTPAGNAVRFQILTAARPGATEAATWSQIKSDNGTSSWEYTVLKGGKPFEQRVPLTPAALALLGERKADDAPLFTLVSNVMLKAIKKASGDDEMTVHGTAKSTFNQWCDDTGIEQGLIDASLAHYRGDKVRRAYSRGDLFDRRRELMDKWSAFATDTPAKP